MKHPVLTRMFSVVLLVLCLVMAAAGGLGLMSAERDRKSVVEDVDRLRLRIGEYEKVAESLSGRQSFSEQSVNLDERETQHGKDSAEHRSELTTYTATQYGINMGTDQMDQADLQFEAYRARFEGGLATFESGMSQVSSLLGNLWTLYNTLSPILQSASSHLATARGIVTYLDSGAELTYAQVVAAYDELLAVADESAATAETLRGLEPTLDALAAFDPNTLTSLADSMGQIPESLGSFGGVDLSVYQENGVDVGFDMNQLVQLKSGFDQSWATIKQMLALYDQVVPQAEAQVQQATGLSTAELRAAAQSARDTLAARGDEPLDPLERELILAAYQANSEQIHQTLDQAGGLIDSINGYAGQIYSTLSAVQGQVDALYGLIAQAKQALIDGANALYQARAMIWWQMGQLREKEEELRKEKERLDRDAEELQRMSEEAEDQKALEQQESTLRAILLSRDGIRGRYEDGEELLDAARSFAEERETRAGETYGLRRLACLIMLVGAGFGLLGLPAAFEAVRSRFLLLTPVLACLGCAAAADRILLNMGRGHSYSVLAVGIFAILQLLVSLPKKRRKKPQGKHLRAS